MRKKDLALLAGAALLLFTLILAGCSNRGGCNCRASRSESSVTSRSVAMTLPAVAMTTLFRQS